MTKTEYEKKRAVLREEQDKADKTWDKVNEVRREAYKASREADKECSRAYKAISNLEANWAKQLTGGR